MRKIDLTPDETLRSEVLALCQQMIQTPSVNGMDDELHLAHIIAAFAREHELEVEMTAIDATPQRLVRIGPQK